jgi:hypothetical protein
VPLLLSRVADGLFVAELHALLEQLPPSRRSQFELSVWRQALLLSPVHKLELLRQLHRRAASRAAATSPSTQPPAPGPDSQTNP